MSSWPLCLWAGPCASYPRQPYLDPAMKEDGPGPLRPLLRDPGCHMQNTHTEVRTATAMTPPFLCGSAWGGGARPEAGSHLSAQAAETPQVPSVLNMSTVTDGLIWPLPHTQIPFHRTPTPGGCHSEGQTVGRTGGTEPSLAWLHLQTRGHILPASP